MYAVNFYQHRLLLGNLAICRGIFQQLIKTEESSAITTEKFSDFPSNLKQFVTSSSVYSEILFTIFHQIHCSVASVYSQVVISVQYKRDCCWQCWCMLVCLLLENGEDWQIHLTKQSELGLSVLQNADMDDQRGIIYRTWSERRNFSDPCILSPWYNGIRIAKGPCCLLWSLLLPRTFGSSWNRSKRRSPWCQEFPSWISFVTWTYSKMATWKASHLVWKSSSKVADYLKVAIILQISLALYRLR